MFWWEIVYSCHNIHNNIFSCTWHTHPILLITTQSSLGGLFSCIVATLIMVYFSWSFHESCYFPPCCFVLSIRFCYPVQFCLYLSSSIWLVCLFSEDMLLFFMSLSRYPTPPCFVSYANYWSLVPVLIIFYNKTFYLPHSTYRLRQIRPGCYIATESYCRAHFITCCLLSQFVLHSIFVLFLFSLYWTANHLFTFILPLTFTEFTTGH